MLFRFTLTALLLFLLILGLSLSLLVDLLVLFLRTPCLSSFVVSSFNHCLLLLLLLSLVLLLLLLRVLLLSALIAFGLWPPLPLSLGIFLFLLSLRLLLGILPLSLPPFIFAMCSLSLLRGFHWVRWLPRVRLFNAGVGLFRLGVLLLGVSVFLLVAGGVPLSGFLSLVLRVLRCAAVLRLLHLACSVPSGPLCPWWRRRWLTHIGRCACGPVSGPCFTHVWCRPVGFLDSSVASSVWPWCCGWGFFAIHAGPIRHLTGLASSVGLRR